MVSTPDIRRFDMKAARARRISAAFGRIHSFAVEEAGRGICIHFLGAHAYFTHEACFWPFAFNLGRAAHEEGQIAEIESELCA